MARTLPAAVDDATWRLVRAWGVAHGLTARQILDLALREFVERHGTFVQTVGETTSSIQNSVM